VLLCLGTLRLASLSINTDSADQERQRPPCPRRWRAAHERASHDVRCNRRRLLRNGFAMLRWYQHRQDESGVVSVSKSATGSRERLQRRGPSRGLYGESGFASLPSSHTNSSTTDRSFTLLLPPSLSPCILLCTFLHSTTRTFRSFLFSAAHTSFVSSCGKSSCPACCKLRAAASAANKETALTVAANSGIFGYINYLVEKDRKYILDTLVNGT
jgi:hypothetical protein